MEAYLFIIIFFWISFLYFGFREVKYANRLSNRQEKKILYWIQAVLFIGILIRTVSLSYPHGIFADEAFGGYDTWCLANYGVDNHLASYPVYFRSWGSGQSALYAYFALPFIKMFGLSVSVFRLPMALWSSVALIVFYWSLRRTQKNVSLIFILILLFAISPWHIMMSRWALDCNLCPNFVLIGVSFILVSFSELSSKKAYLYILLAFTFFVLAAYSYGISWFMLPIFCGLLLIYLYKKNKINIPQVLLCVGWMGIILMPLILFAIVLFFDGDQYRLGPITITELKVGRQHATTLLGRSDFLRTFFSYARRAVILIILGDDFLKWNSFRFWGQFYNLLGIPFIFYSFYNYIKQRNIKPIDWLFIIWLTSMLPILLLVEPNVNHWNLLWFPLIYFLGKGVYLFIAKFPKMGIVTYIVIGCLAISFCVKYFTAYAVEGYTGFTRGIDEVVSNTSKLDVDTIYYTNEIIFSTVLFYDPISPYEYNKIKKEDSRAIIESIDYGKNYFYLPHEVVPKPRTAYVINNMNLEAIDTKSFNVSKGEFYTVLWSE